MAVDNGVTDGPGDVPLVGVGDVLALPHRRGDTVGVANLKKKVAVMEIMEQSPKLWMKNLVLSGEFQFLQAS